jgi:hypothetical protein
MGLDIKLPIGLMFVILGILLLIFGIATNTNPVLYQKSLGININLWVGLAMVAFGGLMLAFSKKDQLKKISKASEEK